MQLDERGAKMLEETGIDGDALRSEATQRMFQEFKETMESPVVKIPTGYGTRVQQWLAALKEQEEDEKDSDELMYEDVANAEKEAEDAERAYGEKYREVEKMMEECKSLKSTMQKKKKEAEGHLAEYNEFKHSRRMLSVVRMLVETSEEVMKCLVEASPDYGRIFEERPRVSLLERMRKRKLAEGASEAESMAAGSERQVKTKAMPKPLKMRKEMAEVVQVDDAIEEKKDEGEGKEKKREDDLSKVNPRWLLKSSERSTRSEKETGTRQPGCFFCKGSHRAIKCQEMLDLAKEITGKVPSLDWREKEKRGLWCKWCWYTTKNPSEHTGWGSHTHQRCWYQKQGQEVEAKVKAEKEKAGAKEVNDEVQKMVDMSERPAEPKGMPPNPQWGLETLKKRKEPETPGPTVEEVQTSDEEAKKKQAKENIKKIKREERRKEREERKKAKKEEKKAKKEERKKAKGSEAKEPTAEIDKEDL